MQDPWWVPPDLEVGDSDELLYVADSSADVTVLQIRVPDRDKSAVIKALVSRSKGSWCVL